MADAEAKAPLLKPRAVNDVIRHNDVTSSINYDSLSTLAGSGIQISEEEQQEVDRGEETQVYTRRWYVLIAYSLVAATQGLVWNTFGPIAATSEHAFGWTDATIALLSNWGPIAYLLSGFLFSWLMDVKGLRPACVLTALLVAAGTGLRCITFDPPNVTWLTHVGQFLNGLGGPVAMAAPAILSAVWFPPHERTTATAIGTVFNYMGVGGAFLMGPWLVPDVTKNSTANGSAFDISLLANTNETGGESIHDEKKGLALYSYIQAIWSGAVLVLLVVYFPSKPPKPPCASAALQREDFVAGLKNLAKRGQFILVCNAYGLSLGSLGAWNSLLDVILKPHGIDEHEAGWIGFYATCAACLVTLIVARFADFFSRMMKLLVVVSYTIGTAAFVVFAMATVNIIPPSTELFYGSIIIGTIGLNAAVPLIYELGCELGYPTGEGTTNTVLTIVNNLFGLIFLLVMMVPGIGSAWTNWCVAGASGLCIPLFLFMKVKYNRLEIDEHNPKLDHQIVFPEPGK